MPHTAPAPAPAAPAPAENSFASGLAAAAAALAVGVGGGMGMGGMMMQQPQMQQKQPGMMSGYGRQRSLPPPSCLVLCHDTMSTFLLLDESRSQAPSPKSFIFQNKLPPHFFLSFFLTFFVCVLICMYVGG